MVFEMGLLATARAHDHGPCVRIEREENYADPSTAKTMTIEIYQSKNFEDLSRKAAVLIISLVI